MKNDSISSDQLLVTKAQIARRYGVSERTIQEWMELGPGRLPLEHHQLMPQRQNFQGEIVPRSEERKRIGQNDPKHGQHDPISLTANPLHSTIT